MRSYRIDNANLAERSKASDSRPDGATRVSSNLTVRIFCCTTQPHQLEPFCMSFRSHLIKVCSDLCPECRHVCVTCTMCHRLSTCRVAYYALSNNPFTGGFGVLGFWGFVVVVLLLLSLLLVLLLVVAAVVVVEVSLCA